MRISFDLDDTIICYGERTPCAPRLPVLLRLLVTDEPIRKGTRELFRELRAGGHEIWIYTSSSRSRRSIRRWLWLHGIRIDDIVNEQRHSASFGKGSLPTKRPHAFGIHLHVDDSKGVAMEGEHHGFKVCVIDPDASDWVEQVHAAVRHIDNIRQSRPGH